MRSLLGILLWKIPLLYLLVYRSFWLNSDRNKVLLLSRLISSLIFQRPFVSLSAHLAVENLSGNFKVPLSHAYPIMNGTSAIQPPAAGKSALSSEAIIGIIGLVLAAFVPLVGFLFRRVLFKTLLKNPTRCNFSTDPQLAWTRVAHINDWASPELHHMHTLLLFDVYCFQYQLRSRQLLEKRVCASESLIDKQVERHPQMASLFVELSVYAGLMGSLVAFHRISPASSRSVSRSSIELFTNGTNPLFRCDVDPSASHPYEISLLHGQMRSRICCRLSFPVSQIR
ncbi:hypothetical protein HDK90DRAFT_127655 [Phyllosticta capitalensis]|uniref:Uncharacterized protein n=1 Tax=Phyllosticta capitalensis TaxID=121624 RepID=A0ABR1YY00_9PEZI